MTVVLDHDANRVVWCAKGHGKAVLKPFFEQLSEDQEGQHTGGDGRRRALDSGARESYCPNAERVMDPFHVVSWMTDVVDELRKQAWRRARAAERRGELAAGGAKAVKGSRYALLKNPEDLTEAQGESLEGGQGGQALYRAYLLKGACATCSKTGSGAEARLRLESWLASACRTRIDEVKGSQEVRRHKDAIVRAVELGISNARVEAINKIKLTVRMALRLQELRQPRGAGHAQVLEPPDRASRALDPTHRNPRSLVIGSIHIGTNRQTRRMVQLFLTRSGGFVPNGCICAPFGGMVSVSYQIMQ